MYVRQLILIFFQFTLQQHSKVVLTSFGKSASASCVNWASAQAVRQKQVLSWHFFFFYEEPNQKRGTAKLWKLILIQARSHRMLASKNTVPVYLLLGILIWFRQKMTAEIVCPVTARSTDKNGPFAKRGNPKYLTVAFLFACRSN